MRNLLETSATASQRAAPLAGDASSGLVLSPDQKAIWGGCRQLLGWPRSPAEDLYNALFRFSGKLHLDSRHELAEIIGRPVLFLANHQTMVESPLFMTLASGLFGCFVSALSHVQHHRSWLGWLLSHHLSHPGIHDPGVMFFFDDQGQREFMRNLAPLRDFLKRERRSLLVHVGGTRVQSCRQPTTACSGVFLRLATRLQMPVVPLRFRGGLPIIPGGKWLDFPIGYTRQDYWLGRPIYPDELAPLDLGQRKRLILERLNSLGGTIAKEQPNPPDHAFAKAVERRRLRWGVPEAQAVVAEALAGLPAPHYATRRLVQALHRGCLEVGEAADERWLAELATWLSDGAIEILAP